jgi:hypothetical protein
MVNLVPSFLPLYYSQLYMSPRFLSALLTVCSLATSLLTSVPAHAQGASFSDVPSTHPAHDAIVYLRDQGLIKGYADGTFKPNQEVDRAAAVKMILAGRVTDDQVIGLANPGFTDIPSDAWYTGYVAKAKEFGIIDGPPKATSFNGSRPVIRAEFLKLLLLAQQMNPSSYSEIQSPLANDVNDPNAWFYPYFRLGLATSIVDIDPNGMLYPEKKMTRGDVAMSVYLLLMYKQNRRTQALLTNTETELAGNVMPNLNAQGLAAAKMAHARALVAVRGALTSRPDSAVVKGAVKVTEGLGALVEAYEAGVSGNPDQVITLAGKAYNLSVQAKEFSPSLDTIVTNIQTIAHNMAEEARALKAKVQ